MIRGAESSRWVLASTWSKQRKEKFNIKHMKDKIWLYSGLD